ncbi:MAG: MAPEG family protein [Alphaproteobacteria bacterium]|nr:MAPEG family protein [Alphaproteobacteria bacterium]
MKTELYWLSLTVLMTALFWLPYILNRIAVRGLIPAITGTKAESFDDQSEWAQRSIRAHTNAVENLVIMAPAVLVAHALNISTPATQLAVIVFFFARLVHFLVYTFGIPVVRTLSFAVGWLCQMTVLFAILGWI